MLSPRVRLLLLNTFDMAEDTISLDNIDYWISELNRTHPDQFASLAPKLDTCDLEAELDTVISLVSCSFNLCI